MKLTDKIPFITLSLTAIYLTICGGCGHTSSEKGTYTETITAEDMSASQELELTAQELPEKEPVTADTPTTEQAPVVDTNKSVLPGSDTVPPPEPPRQRVALIKNIGNYAEVFNDSNHFQLKHAQRLGIQPITDMRSYYHTGRPLVKIATNDDYMLERLEHSYPYLVPEADRLLHDIGRNFREALRKRGAKEYKIVVTSVLRTPETVKKLRRVNVNATEQSTHQYATTFDISYNKFQPVSGNDDVSYVDLKSVLAEVLDDLHKQGRCMIKYEIKSPCFHITVAR